MQAKRRYLFAILGVVLLFIYHVYYWISLSKFQHLITNYSVWNNQNNDDSVKAFSTNLHYYLSEDDILLERDIQSPVRSRREANKNVNPNPVNCRMETCFDFMLCKSGFYVYVYPDEGRMSSKYAQILNTIRESSYYTTDPSKACIFVLSLDTLDRDKLSNEYVDNIQQKIERLQWWRGGLNHLIFNLYSGTWPDYREEDLGFDVGKAMLAKASITDNVFRTGFDISFPLFHKELSSKGGEPGYLNSDNVPISRQYTLVFKGKRYLTGIGSETRNSLYHLHNGNDIVLLTTCKHGREWKKLKDERCEHDNLIYDRFDYKLLMYNSTFCLVPRGRRISSYRFLEALQAACIPVILSNGLVLPFSDVIDWTRAAVLADERLLLQVADTLRSISASEILLYQQQMQFLWNTYFSSVQKIVATTLEILKERVMKNLARDSQIWNQMPGALHTHYEFSNNVNSLPFLSSQSKRAGFTAVILVQNYTLTDIPSSHMTQLLRNLSHATGVKKIIILVQGNQATLPNIKRHVPKHIPLHIEKIKKVGDRFGIWPKIETSCVLSLNQDALVTADELNFGHHVWIHMASRVVGFAARNHFWQESSKSWAYSSKATNQFSIVLTGSAFIHNYFYYLYSHLVQHNMLSVVDQFDACEDILMNMLVSHVTRQSPIKVGPRRLLGASRSSQSKLFKVRQKCLNDFYDQFGYMPLIRSSIRMDPLFFKDQVSVSRKLYRQLELL